MSRRTVRQSRTVAVLATVHALVSSCALTHPRTDSPADRETSSTLLVDTCGDAQPKHAELAELLVSQAWDLGTGAGTTTFGTDLLGDDAEDCPIDVRHRVSVWPDDEDPSLFGGSMGYGVIDRCSNTIMCLVVYAVQGTR